MSQYINFNLVNSYVIIDEIEIDDESFINKLRSLGIYPSNKVYISKLGNMSDMICINANGINNVIRIKDAEKIKVHKVKWS